MLRIRENVAWGVLAALGLFVAASMSGVVSGGPLDPPGPPASTDGVRQPGTPISALPFSITQPGYYYVTRNLTGGPGGSGISITSHDVTLDLGGFTLTGGTSPGTGILVNPVGGGSSAKNIVIRNGAVNSWYSGILVSVAVYSKVHDVTTIGNTSEGIFMLSGFNSEVWNCNASDNFVGIMVSSGTVRNCTVTDNEGRGIHADNNSLIEGNKVRNNNSGGIEVSGSNATIRGNDVTNNGAFDIYLATSIGAAIVDNVYCSLILGSPPTP